MLITIALVDNNEEYSSRLTEAFLTDYADRLEVATFTTLESLDDYLRNNVADVMLVSSELATEALVGKRGATLVYLVDDKSIEQVYGHQAICRYQKVDLIYKGILDACSERFDHLTMRKTGIEGTNILAFLPASGGAGASTMAAACALAFAKHGFKTFYLNLELYGQAQLYFEGEGSGGLDDVLYAIEAQKRNIAMRIQSAVKHSPEGVCFLDSCTSALDVAELSSDQVEQLVREIASSDSYDVMVLDMDFSHSKFVSAVMGLATQTVFVSNGTLTSNMKFERVYKMLTDLNRVGDAYGLANVTLAYNNFRSKTGMKIADDLIRVVGSLPHVSNYQSVPELIETLSVKPVFENMLDNIAQ